MSAGRVVDSYTSERQLKLRFRKWGITKNISREDMSVIIALVKEHEAHGNAITIRCKGCEVDRERIERAMRRYGDPIPSPICERHHI